MKNDIKRIFKWFGVHNFFQVCDHSCKLPHEADKWSVEELLVFAARDKLMASCCSEINLLQLSCNGALKSHEILMLVCLQKDAKWCCDAAKLNCTHCSSQRSLSTNRINLYYRAFRRHSIFWCLFRDKQTSICDETLVLTEWWMMRNLLLNHNCLLMLSLKYGLQCIIVNHS